MADLPTIAEAGFTDALVTAKWFLLVPAKTPPAMVNDLSGKIQKALMDPTARAQLEKLGMTVAEPSRPAEVDQYIRSSVNSWKAFFKTSNIKFS